MSKYYKLKYTTTKIVATREINTCQEFKKTKKVLRL